MPKKQFQVRIDNSNCDFGWNISAFHPSTQDPISDYVNPPGPPASIPQGELSSFTLEADDNQSIYSFSMHWQGPNGQPFSIVSGTWYVGYPPNATPMSPYMTYHHMQRLDGDHYQLNITLVDR